MLAISFATQTMFLSLAGEEVCPCFGGVGLC